jgi:hypothetical protein
LASQTESEGHSEGSTTDEQIGEFLVFWPDLDSCTSSGSADSGFRLPSGHNLIRSTLNVWWLAVWFHRMPAEPQRRRMSSPLLGGQIVPWRSSTSRDSELCPAKATSMKVFCMHLLLTSTSGCATQPVGSETRLRRELESECRERNCCIKSQRAVDRSAATS